MYYLLGSDERTGWQTNCATFLLTRQRTSSSNRLFQLGYHIYMWKEINPWFGNKLALPVNKAVLHRSMQLRV
jgi:hypothetical protein